KPCAAKVAVRKGTQYDSLIVGFSTVESRNPGASRLCRPWLAIIALAGFYTLLNAFKPLVIDDAAYYYYAVQAATKPLDPYGFQVVWWERPDPANEVLAPMGLPYWWGLGIRLFGDRPFLWKLWLLPHVVLLAAAFYSLFRRFAGRYELTLTAF